MRTSRTSSTFGLGLPKTYWDTPRPQKSIQSSSVLGIRRRPSHLDSPLRALKRRRLIRPSDEVEKLDGSFTFVWIVDSQSKKSPKPLNPSPHFPDSSRLECPLRELSRSEWKHRSVQEDHTFSSSSKTRQPIIQSQSSTKTNHSSTHPRRERLISGISEFSLGQDLHPTPANQIQLRRDSIDLAPSASDVPSKPREKTPSQIVRKGNKKYIRRVRQKTEKFTVQEHRRKKVKKLRKKKKKKNDVKLKKRTKVFSSLEIPDMPHPDFSETQSFPCPSDEPQIAVTKCLTSLFNSWKEPLIATYGKDEESNPLGCISRNLILCIERLEQDIPEIVELCELMEEPVASSLKKETTAGAEVDHEKALVKSLESRKSNVEAFSKELEAEIRSMDRMYEQLNRPGFIDELFPRLQMRYDFDMPSNQNDMKEEDSFLKEFELEEEFAQLGIEQLDKEIELEVTIEEDELELHEEKLAVLKKELEVPLTVTKLHKVQQPNVDGFDSLGSFGPQFIQQPGSVIMGGLVQALERERDMLNMDVDE